MSEASRFARFVLSGGLAAIANLASRWLFSLVVVYEIAVLAAYVVGMATAFLLSRSFVFEPSSAPVPRQLGRFTLVNIVAFAQVWLVSVGLARLVFPAIGFTRHAETFAHLIGVSSPVITSYFAHRRYSFE
jgi:putative flippase GtrA